MTKKLLFLLIALAALVVPDIGAAEKSITLTKEDFTNLNGSAWTVGTYGSSSQVKAEKDGVTFHCYLRKDGSGEIGFIPDESFISIQDNPENLAFTKVALSFGTMPDLSNELYLYNVTGDINYGTQYQHFQYILNKNTTTLAMSSFHAPFVSNGVATVDFSSSPADKFFIARNEAATNAGYIGEDPYQLNSITFYYNEGGASLTPEIVFSTPPSQLTTNQSADYIVTLLHGTADLTYTVTSADGDPNSVTITNVGSHYTFSASKAGTYTVAYSATVEGQTVTNSFDVTVSKLSATISIDGAPESLAQESSAEFYVSVNPSDLTLSHTITDLSSNRTVDDSVIGFAHTYGSTYYLNPSVDTPAGKYRITFSVTDEDGDTVSKYFDVEVTEKPAAKPLKFSTWEGEFTTIEMDLGTHPSVTQTVSLNPFSSSYNVEVTPNQGLTFTKGANWTLTATKAGTYSVHVYGVSSYTQEYVEGKMTVIVKGEDPVPNPETVSIDFSGDNVADNVLTIDLKDGNSATFSIATALTEVDTPTVSDPALTVSKNADGSYTATATGKGSFTVAFTGKEGVKIASGSLSVNVIHSEAVNETIRFELNNEEVSSVTYEIGKAEKYIYLLPDYKVKDAQIAPVEGLKINVYPIYGYFTVSGDVPGTYLIEATGTIDGNPAKGTLEFIVIGDQIDVTFEGVPQELHIPANAASASFDFTVSHSAEYTITPSDASVSVVKNEDGSYTLTATKAGDFNVKFENPGYKGTFHFNVVKDELIREPLTFTGAPASLKIGEEEVSASAVFSVIPAADDYVWTISSDDAASSGVTVTKNDGSDEYTITAILPGTYTVKFENQTHTGSFNVVVTKLQSVAYTPITFYDGVTTMGSPMTSKAIDMDNLPTGKFSFAIWPNLRNDATLLNPTFKATVRTLDGTIVGSEVMEVKHGGNTIDVTPHATGEYILRLEGLNSYNFNEDEYCAGELHLIVTGIELTVDPKEADVNVGDIVDLKISPEDGVYTVVSNNNQKLRIIEKDGKFSFEALQEGSAEVTVTRTVTLDDGTTKTKTATVSVNISKLPSVTVSVTNPRQTFEPSEEPYSLWIDRTPIGYCKVKVSPKNGAPADGIRIDLGDTEREYLLYAKEEGVYELTFSGKCLSTDGVTVLQIDDAVPQYTVKVEKDDIEYNLNLTLVDKVGNETDRDEFPMDETIYFIADPKSEDPNGYNTSYYPSNGICRYDAETGIYAFDGNVEDLYSIFVYDTLDSGTLHTNLLHSSYKGKLNVTVLQSTVSTLEFNEAIPARIRINQPLTLTVTDHKYELMDETRKEIVTVTENGERSTDVSVVRTGQTFTVEGHKVGNYRVTVKVYTLDNVEMTASFRIAVVADGTQDIIFVGAENFTPLQETIEMGTEYYFRLIPAGDYTVTAQITGKDSSDGIIVTDLGNGTYSVKALRPEKYTLTAEGTTSATNEPAGGSFYLKVNKGTVVFPDEAYVLSHRHNDGYDETLGHDMTEYTLDDLALLFKDRSHISSVAVTPALDPEWAAKYQWNDDKHSEKHAYYHGLWLGTSVLASPEEKLRGAFNENDDFVMHANVAGRYTVTVRTKAGYYTKDSHSFSIVIDPVITGNLSFGVPYKISGNTLTLDPQYGLNDVEVFTGHWGDIYYSVEKDPVPARYARVAAEDKTADMTFARYSRMDLTDAKAVTVQQKVNGLVTPAVSYILNQGTITGIETIGSDNGEAVYYTLQGIQLPSYPTEKGIYIRVMNGKPEKFLIR